MATIKESIFCLKSNKEQIEVEVDKDLQMRDCNSSLSKIAEDETPTITMTMSREMYLSGEIIPKNPKLDFNMTQNRTRRPPREVKET